MKISIVTLGTRGDVQPYIALARRLQDRGHVVSLAAPENFAQWITSHRLTFHSMGVDMEALLQTPEVRNVIAGNWLKIPSIWQKMILPMVRASLEATAAAATDAEVIVFHPKAAGVVDVAEATGALAICATPLPMAPTREFPLWVMKGSYGGFLNRLSWQLLRSARAPYARLLNTWRRESLGLGKGRSFAPVGRLHDGDAIQLCAVSPAVLPRPRDWPQNVHMVGYWFLDDEEPEDLDANLTAFLDAGEPPVYVGLGSMTTRNPQQLAQRFAQAISGAGCRTLLARGWGGMEAPAASDSVYVIDGAPHQALFQRVQAVIHHGGAGTTAAGLRAGLPTLVFPQVADQALWGRRIKRLACGPSPVTRMDIESEALEQRVRDLVHRQSYRLRAQELASTIAQEDGIATAIDLIEAAGSRRSRSWKPLPSGISACQG